MTQPLLRILLCCLVRNELTLQTFCNRGANSVCHLRSTIYSHKTCKNFVSPSSLDFVAKCHWKSYLGKDSERCWADVGPHTICLLIFLLKKNHNTLGNLNNFCMNQAVGCQGLDYCFVRYKTATTPFLPSPVHVNINLKELRSSNLMAQEGQHLPRKALPLGFCPKGWTSPAVSKQANQSIKDWTFHATLWLNLWLPSWIFCAHL